MVAEIRQILEARPFRPFHVLTSGGNRYRVASADHADISPSGNQIIIWFDDEGSITVAGLHIVAVEKEPVPQSQPA